MKRWQLWSSVVGGVFSVVAPGSYYGWQYLANRDVRAAQATPDSKAKNSATTPPNPVVVAVGDEIADERTGFAPGYASTASAVEPTSNDDAGSSANSRRSAFPVTSDGTAPARPSSEFAANDGVPPRPSSLYNPDTPGIDSQASARIGDDAGVAATDADPASTGAPSAGTTTRITETDLAAGESISSPSQFDGPPPMNSRVPPQEIAGDDPQNSTQDLTRGNASLAPAGRSGGLPEVDLSGSSADGRPDSDSPINEDSAPTRLSVDRTGMRRNGLGALQRVPDSASGYEELTSAAPGERRLEGSQAPALLIEKTGPEEIQVGKAAKFSIKVRNAGSVDAHGVVIRDRVPAGTRFLASTPETTPAQDGGLVWEIGTLQSAQETTIQVELMPESEGEIGSVAQVTFAAQAGVRTLATRPLLAIEHSGPGRVLIGEKAAFTITISNPGSGVASGVVVEVDVPSELAHEGGREIMSDRFELRPNETRKLDLVLTAAQAGIVESVVRAVGDAGLKTEHRTQLEVVAPQLQLGVNGPTRRYLNRQVTYQIVVNNPGTAGANDIELVAFLPQGLKFVGTDNKGRYEPGKHAVYWSLEELPAGESGTVQLSAMPIDTGDQKLHVEGRAALDLSANFDHTTVVEALTELVFTVADENDPIEVGADTSYEVRILNNGSKNATVVQFAAVLPPELVPQKADGPTKLAIQGQEVIAEPLAQLAPGEEVTYRIAVKGLRAGDHLVRVQVVSKEVSTPVTKEESTKVYADE